MSLVYEELFVNSTAATRGLPSVSVPVLSMTRVSTCARVSSAWASRINTPAWAPRPTATIADMGVANPSAHGHAMISTAIALTKRMREARLRTQGRPGHKRQHRRGDYCRNKISRYFIREALHRSAAALRFADQFHDACQHGVAAETFGFHHETPAGIKRAAGYFVSG